MLFENCRLKAKRVVNPIVDWTDKDVWDFLGAGTQVECGLFNVTCNNIPVNPVYARFERCRVGCIGCPLAGPDTMREEFAIWPAFEKLYLLTFERMLEERKRRGKMEGTWRMGLNGRDVMHWWLQDGVLPGQIDLFVEDDYDLEDL